MFSIRRYPIASLHQIAYGLEPMSVELAELVRVLRKHHGVTYEQMGFYLSESDPDKGTSFGLGKALTELAALHLEDADPTWT